MTDLEILCEAFTRVGIYYTIRGEEGAYQYLFMRSEKYREYYEQTQLDFLLRIRPFIEFENGKLASY